MRRFDKLLSPGFILVVTFISAYVPTIYSVLTSESPGLAAFKKPDLLAGLMGFLFSVLLTLGETYYRKVNESIEQLVKKIDAQSRGNKLQEAFLKAKEGPYSPLFGKLAERRLDRIQSNLEDMMRDLPFYDVRQTDPVKEYVDIFVQLMIDIIHPESEFRVVTTEVIWSPNGFGSPDRRYLLANFVAAKERKVKLKRVFMVDQRGKLLQNRKRAEMTLRMLRDHERTFSEPGVNVDFAVYEAESDEDYESFFRSPSNSFALWNVSEKHQICTVVEYARTADGYSISGFKFASDPMLIKEKGAVYEDLRARAKPLRDYLQILENEMAAGSGVLKVREAHVD